MCVERRAAGNSCRDRYFVATIRRSKPAEKSVPRTCRRRQINQCQIFYGVAFRAIRQHAAVGVQCPCKIKN